MRRQEFIALVAGTLAGHSVVRAQQPVKVRGKLPEAETELRMWELGSLSFVAY
jgi:hypothetical protein